MVAMMRRTGSRAAVAAHSLNGFAGAGCKIGPRWGLAVGWVSLGHGAKNAQRGIAARWRRGPAVRAGNQPLVRHLKPPLTHLRRPTSAVRGVTTRR